MGVNNNNITYVLKNDLHLHAIKYPQWVAIVLFYLISQIELYQRTTHNEKLKTGSQFLISNKSVVHQIYLDIKTIETIHHARQNPNFLYLT